MYSMPSERRGIVTPHQAFEREFGSSIEQISSENVVSILSQRFNILKDLFGAAQSQKCRVSSYDYFAARGIEDWNHWTKLQKEAARSFNRARLIAQRFVAEDLSFLRRFTFTDPGFSYAKWETMSQVWNAREGNQDITNISPAEQAILRGNITLKR